MLGRLEIKKNLALLCFKSTVPAPQMQRFFKKDMHVLYWRPNCSIENLECIHSGSLEVQSILCTLLFVQVGSRIQCKTLVHRPDIPVRSENKNVGTKEQQQQLLDAHLQMRINQCASPYPFYNYIVMCFKRKIHLKKNPCCLLNNIAVVKWSCGFHIFMTRTGLFFLLFIRQQ